MCSCFLLAGSTKPIATAQYIARSSTNTVDVCASIWPQTTGFIACEQQTHFRSSLLSLRVLPGLIRDVNIQPLRPRLRDNAALAIGGMVLLLLGCQKHKIFILKFQCRGFWESTKQKYLLSCMELHFVQCTDVRLSGEFLGKPSIEVHVNKYAIK